MLPWLDHAGRFSAFKTVVLVAVMVPGASISADFLAGNLGPRPHNEAVHQIGLWTIRLLFISLAVTPLRQFLRWQNLIQIRRMVGVAAFTYAAAHLVLYAADEKFNMTKVATEIVVRFYLTIGFVALLGLTALAVTSTDGMVRRMGARAWSRLHQAIYVVGVLAVIHFFLQTKLDVHEPTVMAGLFVWLMGYRLVARLGNLHRRAPITTAFALALSAAVLTALGEAAYFWVAMGVDPIMVLEASIMFEIGIRPAWVVFGITFAVAVATAIRRFSRSAKREVRSDLRVPAGLATSSAAGEPGR